MAPCQMLEFYRVYVSMLEEPVLSGILHGWFCRDVNTVKLSTAMLNE
jgi:hypothetical protein